MKDTRNPNDVGRIMDSMFRPREFASSRRGRVLVVLAGFLIIETAMLITQLEAGVDATFAWALWALWLVGCVVFVVVPGLGGGEDAPPARRTTALLAATCAVLGLAVFGLLAVLGHALPGYWWMIVASITVAAATAHLGVRALTR